MLDGVIRMMILPEYVGLRNQLEIALLLREKSETSRNLMER